MPCPIALKKIVLLSSVCALALSIPHDARARRLLPDMPSVEVHFEALEALRYSVTAQDSGGAPRGWDVGPAGKIVSAPVGYPVAPSPAPVAPRVAQMPAPLPKPEPLPEIAKAPEPEPTPVAVVPPPAQMPAPLPKPEPLPEIAKAPEPEPAPVAVVPPMERKRPTEQPPLELTQEVSPPDLSLLPLEPMPEPSPVALPDAPPAPPKEAEKALEKELEALPAMEPAEDVMPSISADLPEPDLKSLEPLPMPESEAKKESAKKAPELEETTSAEPVKKIVIKAPEEELEKKEAPSLEELGLPGLEEAPASPDSEPELADLAPLPPAGEATAELPSLPEPGEESPPEIAAPEAPVASPLPPPALPELESPKEVKVPPAKKEEKGMFSGLKGMIGGLLGSEEEKPMPEVAVLPPPSTPAPMEPLPLPDETASLPEPPVASLPPLPGEEPEVAVAPSGLPPLDALTSKPEGHEDALTFVKSKTGDAETLPPLESAPLPSLGKEEALQEKALTTEPVENQKSSDKQLPSLAELGVPDLPPEEPKKSGAPQAMPEAPLSLPVPLPVQKSLEPVVAPKVQEKVAMQVTFAKTETEVPLSSQNALKNLAKELTAPGNNRGVSVVAYASGSKDQESIARRVSLSRALSIRAFLIDSGVDNLRINVQAMGNKEDDSDNPERADIFVK